MKNILYEKKPHLVVYCLWVNDQDFKIKSMKQCNFLGVLDQWLICISQARSKMGKVNTI
jgi:hypothetical protein